MWMVVYSVTVQWLFLPSLTYSPLSSLDTICAILANVSEPRYRSGCINTVPSSTTWKLSSLRSSSGNLLVITSMKSGLTACSTSRRLTPVFLTIW